MNSDTGPKPSHLEEFEEYIKISLKKVLPPKRYRRLLFDAEMPASFHNPVFETLYTSLYSVDKEKDILVREMEFFISYSRGNVNFYAALEEAILNTTRVNFPCAYRHYDMSLTIEKEIRSEQEALVAAIKRGETWEEIQKENEGGNVEADK